MSWLWLFPLLGALVLVAVCAHLFVDMRRLAEAVDALVVEAGQPEAPPAQADGGNLSLAVQILNPIEVACANSRLAGPISAVSPELLRRKVYQQISVELQEQLGQRGIHAQVTVLGGAS